MELSYFYQSFFALVPLVGLRNLRSTIEQWLFKPDPMVSAAIRLSDEAASIETEEDPEEVAARTKVLDEEIDAFVSKFERLDSIRMLSEAHRLNLDFPVEDDLWVKIGDRKSLCSPLTKDGVHSLSRKGKLVLQRAIDEERVRRREVSAWWWKNVIIPGMTALTGLAGALTGLFAVLRHSK